jgi:PPOX class probable F420-dependent enzyme
MRGSTPGGASCLLRVVFEDWQLELIAGARRGVLATTARDGRAHLVPVCYAFEGGGFGIAIDEKPKLGTQLARTRNIARDQRVSLLIDRYDDDWTQLAWVRIDGLATVFERGAEQPAMLRSLRERYPQYETMALDERPLIMVEPTHVAAWRWEGGTQVSSAV